MEDTPRIGCLGGSRLSEWRPKRKGRWETVRVTSSSLSLPLGVIQILILWVFLLASQFQVPVPTFISRPHDTVCRVWPCQSALSWMDGHLCKLINSIPSLGGHQEWEWVRHSSAPLSGWVGSYDSGGNSRHVFHHKAWKTEAADLQQEQKMKQLEENKKAAGETLCYLLSR